MGWVKIQKLSAGSVIAHYIVESSLWKSVTSMICICGRMICVGAGASIGRTSLRAGRSLASAQSLGTLLTPMPYSHKLSPVQHLMRVISGDMTKTMTKASAWTSLASILAPLLLYSPPKLFAQYSLALICNTIAMCIWLS